MTKLYRVFKKQIFVLLTAIYTVVTPTINNDEQESNVKCKTS